MDIFHSDPDVDDEATLACSELEKINSSNDIPDVSPCTTPPSTVAVTHPVAVCSNSNNRKRCYSVLIQGSSETTSPNHTLQNGDVQETQEQQQLSQIQQTQQIIVHPKQFTPQRFTDTGNQAVFHHTAVILSTPRQKIPRPPNAFMLFANEWRKKLAVQFPRESNKDISVRLGAMWKTMQKEEKEKYFTLAREVDAEHKRKYPDYVYNPKEARMRKALREQSRETRNQLSRCHTATTILPNSGARQQQWGSKGHHQSFTPGIGGRQTHNRQGLMSPRMLAEQQRNIEETKKAIREQVEQGMIQGYTETYLDIEAIPYHQLNHMNLPGGGDYVIAEIDGQQWLPYMHTPQPGASYMMRPNEDVKLQQGGPWNQYAAEARAQQVPSYTLRQQIMNGAYGNCMPNQHIVETSSSSQQGAVIGQANRNDRCGNSDGNIPSGMEQQYMYQQQTVSNSTLTQNMTSKEELNREERMQMLELIPTTNASSKSPVAATSTSSSAATTTTVKSETSSSASTSQLQTAATSQNKNSKIALSSNSQPSITDITSALSDNTDTANGTENSNGPLPAFEQAFGSTEIGRYSHEGFFNSTQQNENQQSTNNQNLDPISIPVETNHSDMANNQQTDSNPDEFPTPGTPTMVFSPTKKIPIGESLMSPSGWPSLYYYSPNSTTINQKGITSVQTGQRHNLSHPAFTCYGSPQYPHPSYAAYFDCAFLSGQEFIAGSSDAETILVGVPGPTFGDGNELQVALDGGGSTVLASGNTYRDTEAGLDYVTLHIPANAITGNANDPLEITNENGEPIILANDDAPEIAYEEIENHSTKNQRKHETYACSNTKSSTTVNMQHKSNDIMINNSDIIIEGRFDSEKETNVSEKMTKKDDLERQDLTITGMAVREPIVISQTERICVLMDTPNPVTDGKEFTSL